MELIHKVPLAPSMWLFRWINSIISISAHRKWPEMVASASTNQVWTKITIRSYACWSFRSRYKQCDFVYKKKIIPGFVNPTKFTVISPSLVTFSRLTKSPLGISYLSNSSLLNMNPNLKFSKLNDMNKTNGSPTSIVISASTGFCNYIWKKRDIGRGQSYLYQVL